MALSVFTNGGKLHEHFLNKYGIRSNGGPNQKKGQKENQIENWTTYAETAGKSILSENEKLMLPYLMDESLPLKTKGIFLDGFSRNDADINIRALHISQVLSLKLHSTHLDNVDTICVVGGGAENKFMVHLIANFFQATTYTIKNAGYAAPWGCAISGAKVLLGISYKEAAERYVQKDENSLLQPLKHNTQKVNTLLARYAALEKREK